ncbi:MAG: hypothetical protein EXS09_19725 [Gemmataceae bacterium]|nr:hypothetical protein [Gemmataceae bacterium]
MSKLFGITLFVSATLLFLVQPMVGKMVLPLLGGTPAVWNTCMVFFQALLLAGYYYSHRTTTTLLTPKQVRVHSALLFVTLGAFALAAALIENHSPVPIVKSLAPQGSDLPFFGVLLLLAAAIGLPFFTVSTTAPLLQKWFSETGHPSAKDPYFLYAASNFGSLLALVAYPFVVEPNLTLVAQAWMWAGGFLVLTGLIFLCGKAVLNAPPPKPPIQKSKKAPEPKPVDEPLPPWTTRLRWLILAAIPSSLMLAVTTDVTTDMVSMPLLWVIPLALYLITFIIVFSKLTPSWVHLTATLLSPVLILLVLFTKTAEPVSNLDLSRAPAFVQTLLQLLPFATFFMVTLTCHGELARTRPSSKHLTNFYLLMSVGGVVGGLFNAFFAPIMFTFISEYPITLVAACFVLPQLTSLTQPDVKPEPRAWTVWDAVLPLLFFAAARFLSAYFADLVDGFIWLKDKTGTTLPPKTGATIVAFGLPTLCSYFLVENPRRFGAVVGAIWIGTFLTFMMNERKKDEEFRTIYTRSFFGSMKIESHWKFHRLVHGTTVHGSQQRYPDEYSTIQVLSLLGANGPADALGLAWIADPHLHFPGREPLTYYHRTGPVGDMFWEFWQQNKQHPGRNEDVACIGLGTGSLSAYALPGRKTTFFEIDWTVRRLVEEPKHFTYIQRAKDQCGAENMEFIMGDARLSLEQTDRKWGLMLIDAFSSDSIPAHLLTKQALELYFNRLSDDGLLALHISNRYLKLEPVVDQLVRSLGYAALKRSDHTEDSIYPDKVEVSGKLASSWVIVAKKKEALGGLLDDPNWGPLESRPSVGLWTDDHTPITKALEKGWWTLFGR